MEIGIGMANTCSPATRDEIKMPTVVDRLTQRKFQLQSSLKDVTEALEALEANPEVMKIINLVSKVNY